MTFSRAHSLHGLVQDGAQFAQGLLRDDGVLVFEEALRTGVARGQIGAAGDLDVPGPGEDPAPYRAQRLPLDGLGEGIVLGALHLLQAAGADDGEGGAQGIRSPLGTGSSRPVDDQATRPTQS